MLSPLNFGSCQPILTISTNHFSNVSLLVVLPISIFTLIGIIDLMLISMGRQLINRWVGMMLVRMVSGIIWLSLLEGIVLLNLRCVWNFLIELCFAKMSIRFILILEWKQELAIHMKAVLKIFTCMIMLKLIEIWQGCIALHAQTGILMVVYILWINITTKIVKNEFFLDP